MRVVKKGVRMGEGGGEGRRRGREGGRGGGRVGRPPAAGEVYLGRHLSRLEAGPEVQQARTKTGKFCLWAGISWDSETGTNKLCIFPRPSQEPGQALVNF